MDVIKYPCQYVANMLYNVATCINVYTCSCIIKHDHNISKTNLASSVYTAIHTCILNDYNDIILGMYLHVCSVVQYLREVGFLKLKHKFVHSWIFA